MKFLKPAALAILAFTMSAPALACSCLPPPSAQDQFDSSEIMFIGTVIDSGPKKDIRPWYAWMTPWHEPSLTPWDAEQVTTFQVDRMLKGPNTLDTITFAHGVSGASCGVVFSTQQSGLFIGYKRTDGFYSTSLCSMPFFSDEEFIAIADAKTED